jgi:hypothetical protein
MARGARANARRRLGTGARVDAANPGEDDATGRDARDASGAGSRERGMRVE